MQKLLLRSRVYVAIPALILMLGVGGWLILSHIPWYAVPSSALIKELYATSETKILDRNGHIIHTLRSDFERRRLEWVGLENISPALTASVIASEDQRFFTHNGVDPLAFFRVIYQMITSGKKPQGASTLTMQLAGMIDPDLRPGRYQIRRSISQKFNQIFYAWSVEQSWSKPDILEAYLNLVSFRGEIQGVGAASKAFFDKKATGLNDEEVAILAVTLRAPNAEISITVKRACDLRQILVENFQCDEINHLTKKVLTPPYHIRREANIAPHIAQKLLREETTRPDIISTTLDIDVQNYVNDSIQNHIGSLKERNLHDAAVLVLDNSTGNVIAYVGSSGFLSKAKHVNGVQARRQAGSSLKPFIYL